MNELLEDEFIKLAVEIIAAKKYKIFDKNSRRVKRDKFPEPESVIVKERNVSQHAPFQRQRFRVNGSKPLIFI